MIKRGLQIMKKSTDHKMKMLFYIPGLVDGGAERVMASLASQFAQQGHRVMLAVDFKVDTDGPPLDPAVTLIELSKEHRASVQKLARLLMVVQPDIAISAIASNNIKLIAANFLARAFALYKRSMKAPRINLVLTYHGFEEYKTGWMSWLGYVTLPIISRMAQRVVAVSTSLRSNLVARWKAKRKNTVRIYNPVSIPAAPEGTTPQTHAATLHDHEKMILSVGRLVADKRFDLVIKAVDKMKDRSASLVILGEGPERKNLENLIQELDLSQRVTLQGFTTQTGHFYARAKCFALTSRKESFGLVLVEALAYGLPVLSTDCGGPREVLDDGRYGVLLAKNPTVDELAKALDNALDNPGDPQPRIERAKSFDMNTGVQQYDELFAEILRENA